MNRSTRRVLSAAVFAPMAVLFALVSTPAQACTHDGSAAEVKDPLGIREPLMAAGTMKDALPAGLGDAELPNPLGDVPLGRSGVPDGSSGRFGGLPGLGTALPTGTLSKLPVAPALG